MADTSGIGLKEPDQVNWDNYNPGSNFKAPPPVLGADGKAIKYSAVVPKLEDKSFGVTNDGFRSYLLDPLTITRSGSADGYAIRFTRFSTKKYERNGKTVERSGVGDFLRSAGIQAKPQRNAEYDAAVKATQGKVVQFVLDWEARNKDTGEEVKGYRAFPNDPERPGQKKAILKAGDIVTDWDPTTQTTTQRVIQSEVLFANARVRYFVDPARKG